MEDLVGIRVVDRAAGDCAFVTWGRVFDPVDSHGLLEAVRPHLRKFGLHDVESIELCASLRDVAHHKYFYEALFEFSRKPSPPAKKYEKWLEKRRKAIEGGRELYFLGVPETGAASGFRISHGSNNFQPKADEEYWPAQEPKERSSSTPIQ